MFTNSTINSSQQRTTVSRSNKVGKAGGSLAINKTAQERDLERMKLQEKHGKHLAKVQTLKNTLSQNGSLSTRTLRGADHMGSGVIKTIILPNEEINRLAIEAEELKQFLSAQRQVYEESVAAFDKDRIIREQEFVMKNQEFKDTLDGLRARIETRKASNYTLARDFFDYKHVISKTR